MERDMVGVTKPLQVCIRLVAEVRIPDMVQFEIVPLVAMHTLVNMRLIILLPPGLPPIGSLVVCEARKVHATDAVTDVRSLSGWDEEGDRGSIHQNSKGLRAVVHLST